MNRLSVFSLSLCLLVGFLVGIICPTPWSGPKNPVQAASTGASVSTASAKNNNDGSSSSAAAPALDPTDNALLLDSALLALRALKEQDYNLLSTFVHPTRGVTFTPYSTVNFETDLTFTANQIRSLTEDKNVYTWGSVDGHGKLIELTMAQYMEQYVFHTDYTQAPEIGIDQIMISGNALENLAEAYPDCRFVDFTFPSFSPDSQGLDWCSLKLVFEAGESKWSLVGIIHGQWTV